MKTLSAKNHQIKRKWFLVDVTGKTLGRISSKIAILLRGKHKPEYTPHIDTGDYIIIINANKVIVSGNKTKNKIYYHHTGYIGGIKSISFDKLMIKSPTSIIERAVKGMLPKNTLGRKIFSKLKVYSGNAHPHTAQNPQKIF